jgi:glycosyltransferase involved in cell wall biosynthesis
MALNGKPAIAVIVPLRNEAAGLQPLLAALLGQLPEHGEIVAVDTGSRDGTDTIIRSIAAKDTRLRLVRAAGALPGAARNTGIANTTAPIIVQVDGGCMVGPGWIESMYGPIRDDKADYVTGAVAPLAAPARFCGISHDAALLFFAFMAWSPRSQTVMAGGAAVAYRRTIWERCNGQPDWLRVGEDVLFAAKARHFGIRHHFAGAPPCRWQAGPRLRDVIRRRYRYVKGDILLPELGPSTKPGLLRMILFVIPCAAVGLWPAAPIVSAILLLAFSVRFWFKAVRRYRTASCAPDDRLPRPEAAAILAAGTMAWLAAEAAGLSAGLIVRFTKPSIIKRARDYLQTPSEQPL